MTPRHILMGGALAIAAWLAIFGDKTPSGDIAEPVARSSDDSSIRSSRGSGSESAATNDKTRREQPILALIPRQQLIGGARGEGRPYPLFGSQSWTPPPPPAPPPTPPPPPTAPPLPYTVLGKKVEDGKWEVFLARGEQTFIVREGSTIEGTYQVKSIAPPDISLVYLPLKQVQTLTIGGTD
ncbi:MAG: hypothetical protein HYS18_13090 [Burkholderiales bacterium]|nr:hypothetical protein [Burkholderiales bacterium]